jgi:hypothetical protein
MPGMVIMKIPSGTQTRSVVGSRSLSLIAAFACLVTAPPVLAEGGDPLSDPFQLTLGTFLVNTDTEVRVDGKLGTGTPIDFDRSFGDDGDQTRFRLDGSWRFAERHKVRAMVFSTSRSNSREFDQDIEWDDEIFPIGARIKGEVDFDVYQVAYEYLFLRRESWDLGASIGVHYTTFETQLSASVASGGTGGSVTRKADADLNAPLPVIGLHGTWSLGNDLWLDATAQFFSLSIDEYDGSLQDYRIGLVWQPKSWAGIGIGYNRFNVDVDVDSSGFKGALDWSYDGPIIYYSAMF